MTILKFLQSNSHSLYVCFQTSQFLMVGMVLPYNDWRSARYIRVHSETTVVSKCIWPEQIRTEKPPFSTEKHESWVEYLWLLYFEFTTLLCKCECCVHIHLTVKTVSQIVVMKVCVSILYKKLIVLYVTENFVFHSFSIISILIQTIPFLTFL
jgi:hypothetical protein